MKKLLMILLTMTMILSSVCFISEDEVQAAGDETPHVESMEISQYVIGETRIAPKPKVSGYENYLFAGWYSDEECTEVSEVTEGSVYAKFVPAQVLSAGCQITSTVTDSSATSCDLRIVSTVDGANYRTVGFKLTCGADWSYTSSTTNVFEKITTTTSGLDYTKTPTIFDTESVYFFTFKVYNIPSSYFSEAFYITPYWVTLDGTEVDGITRCARVEDGYLGYVNVPIRLYTDEAVAAGYLEVSIPGGCTYIGCDSGIFEEMEVNGDGAAVKLVGNVADINEDKNADGLYANLRFKVAEDVPADDAFTVSGVEFCDKAEALKDLSVVEAAYNDFK